MSSPISSNPGQSAFSSHPENGYKDRPASVYRTRRAGDLSLRIDIADLTRDEVGDRMAELGRRMFDEQEGVMAHSFNRS